ncbi:MAG: TetR/AcrR family transcriptional regulator [Pseudomonadales bacterium]
MSVKPARSSLPPSKQGAKSQRAREAICRATVGCLYELGYSATSINRVAARAGLSKGAVQHHFPIKEDLMTATADHLLRQTQRFADRIRAGRGDGGSVAQELMLNWSKMIDTPEYRALLELLVATRTDRELAGRLKPTLLQWNRDIDRSQLALYEAASGDDDEVILLMHMYRALMSGLLIQESYFDGPTDFSQVLARWAELMAPLLKGRRRPAS